MIAHAPAGRAPGPRVLVLSASIGAGHVRAAGALIGAMRRLEPDLDATHVDVLDCANRVFCTLYGRFYLELIASSPNLAGTVYDHTNRVIDPARLHARVLSAVQRACLKPLVRLMTSGAWDAIVSTHFLPAQIAAELARARRVRCPRMTVVTDFDAHAIWTHAPTDRYLVASHHAACTLRSFGVPGRSIAITGIPIEPGFAPTDRALRAARARAGLGLAVDGRPTVLLLAGGLGMGPIAQLRREIARIERPLNIAVVCGRNDRLRRELLAESLPARHASAVVGFRDDMPEILTCADVAVGKSGGLTSSEIMAAGVPLVVMAPIPGQEVRNCEFLLEHGCAIKISTVGVVRERLMALLDDPRRLARLREQCLATATPDSAHHAAMEVLGLMARADATPLGTRGELAAAPAAD